MVCDYCGRLTMRKIYVNAQGLCPGCHAGSQMAANAAHSILTDDIPGGQVIENLGDEPMTFYSKKAILAEADRQGLRLRDEWAGPSDQHLTNWAASIDAQTLENARVLLSRSAERAEPKEEDFTWHSFEVAIRTVKLSEVA